MTKRTVTKLWFWSLVAWIPAGILVPSAAIALAAHDGAAGDRYGNTMLALIALGGLFFWTGLVVQLVAWIGALLNTHALETATWFRVLLWGGIAGIIAMPLFGVGALVFGSVILAYLVAAPDSLAAVAEPTTPHKSTITKWTGWGFTAMGAGFALALVVANLTNQGRPLHGVVWPSLAIESFGIAVAVLGSILLVAAWWGAIFNAHELTDQTWFKRLLWSGIVAAVTMLLLGLGGVIVAVVLIAYWHSAPDGIGAEPPRTTPPARMVVTG